MFDVLFDLHQHLIMHRSGKVYRAKESFGVQTQIFGSVRQVERGVSQQIIGMNPQD